MKVTVKIVETYTKYEEVEIEDTGKLDEAYEDVDEKILITKHPLFGISNTIK